MWTACIQALFNQQLDSFEPQKIVKDLLERHPWLHPQGLEEDNFSDDHLVRRFLKTHLRSQLKARLRLQQPAAVRDWSDFPGASLESKTIEWEPIDRKWQEWLSSEREGYPLSQVREFYLNHRRPEYPSFLALRSVSQARAASICCAIWRVIFPEKCKAQ